jgi:hypothetical protein
MVAKNDSATTLSQHWPIASDGQPDVVSVGEAPVRLLVH